MWGFFGVCASIVALAACSEGPGVDFDVQGMATGVRVRITLATAGTAHLYMGFPFEGRGALPSSHGLLFEAAADGRSPTKTLVGSLPLEALKRLDFALPGSVLGRERRALQVVVTDGPLPEEKAARPLCRSTAYLVEPTVGGYEATKLTHVHVRKDGGTFLAVAVALIALFLFRRPLHAIMRPLGRILPLLLVLGALALIAVRAFTEPNPHQVDDELRPIGLFGAGLGATAFPRVSEDTANRDLALIEARLGVETADLLRVALEARRPSEDLSVQVAPSDLHGLRQAAHLLRQLQPATLSQPSTIPRPGLVLAISGSVQGEVLHQNSRGVLVRVAERGGD